jgi:hypothetical protein
MNPPPIGVFIVEDHPATREGLRAATACHYGEASLPCVGALHRA